MKLHSGLPYWIIKNRLYDYYNPLKDDVTADVAVVGSGITGALAAHELCKAGFDCCVLDKRSIATGSSAASTALLQYEIDLPLHKLAEKIGEDKAVTAYRSCLDSITELGKILEETSVQADFVRRPSIFYASDSKGEEIIAKEYEIRTRQACRLSLFHVRPFGRNMACIHFRGRFAIARLRKWMHIRLPRGFWTMT